MDLEAEAGRRWEYIREKIGDEDVREVFIRAGLKDLVDEGQELSIEWEVWSIVLDLFFLQMADDDYKKQKARYEEYWAEKVYEPIDSQYIEQVRAEICKILFFHSPIKRVAHWEQGLRDRLEQLVDKDIDPEVAKEIRWSEMILQQLDEYRERGGFGPDFILQYGYKMLRGNYEEKEKMAEEIAYVRSKDLWKS